MNHQCPVCQQPLKKQSEYWHQCHGQKDHIYDLSLKRNNSIRRATIFSYSQGYYTYPKVISSIRLDNYDYYYEMNHAQIVFIETKPIFDPQFLATYFKSLLKLKAFL